MLMLDLPRLLSASLLLSTTTTTTTATALAQSCWRDVTCTGPATAAFPGPWDSNNFSPASRTVAPASVLALANASVISSYPGASTLIGNASALVFDFGIEVGGLVTVDYRTTGGPGRLGLAFSEAKNWIGLASDSSNGDFSGGVATNFTRKNGGDQSCDDGAIYGEYEGEGSWSYTMDSAHLRGGFRYLTLFLLTNGTDTTLEIEDVSLEIAFQPTWSNLRAYQGYFHSNDEELNKIWYSGAYTLQTNQVPPDTGRVIPALKSGWANNASMSNGSTVIVDGAKRDRAVWPGDMGIAVPSTFYSLGPDLDSVRNALQAIYDYQNADGSFPEAGPPLLQQSSDTYHCWTMIGTYNYVLYTNDTAFLTQNWARYGRAMEYIYGKVLQPLGLLNVTGLRDWARQGTGGNSSEPNMILYRTLVTGASLAEWTGAASLATTYTTRAAALKTNIFAHLYDASYGAYADNTSTTLHPQDANSLALLYGLYPDATVASSISSRLTHNWTPLGAEAPELPHNISPFISSFEVQGHLALGETARALDLIRRSWGWYLAHPNGTGSTVIEGYLTNGSFGYRNYRGYFYDPSYVSHAHGWSSGPTSALTNYVLGLEVTGRVGSAWRWRRR
ncbi:glycoside hydrolase family 78 protein, partial [Teratosphaeria destructans]